MDTFQEEGVGSFWKTVGVAQVAFFCVGQEEIYGGIPSGFLLLAD